MTKRAIILDLDDTLYLWRDFALSGFKTVDQWLRSHRGVSGFFDECEQLFYAGVRQKIYDQTLEKLGIDVEPELVRQMLHIYREHVPEIKLCSDAPKVLEYFQRENYSLGLITDGLHPIQQTKISVLGLRPIFQSVICTDALGEGFAKPHARSFEMTMETFSDVSPENFIYIGDNPNKDFLEPKKMGWSTIRIRRPLGEYFKEDAPSLEFEADFTVDSLEALL